MPIFTVPLYEHGDPGRPGPYPHGKGTKGLARQAAYLQRLDTRGAKAIRQYTRWTPAMVALNEALRADRRPRPLLQRLQQALSETIQQAPPLTRPVTVWRGLAERHLQGLKPGDTLTMKGFSSGSLDQEIAARRAVVPSLYDPEPPALLAIETRRGLHIASASIIPSEQEFLFDHNTMVTLTGIERNVSVPVNVLHPTTNQVIERAPVTVIRVRVG